jgi:hypothetical protein
MRVAQDFHTIKGINIRMTGHQEKVGFIWSVADLLRGDYKNFEYGRVILPFTVLQRLDCVLKKPRIRFWRKPPICPQI